MQGFFKKKTLKNKAKQVNKIRLKIDSKLNKDLLKKTSRKTLLKKD